MRRFVIATCFGLSLTAVLVTPVDAGQKVHRSEPVPIATTAEHPKASYYRRAPQVRGFLQRRGGYSFGRDDATTTYSGYRYGSNPANPFRSPFVYQ